MAARTNKHTPARTADDPPKIKKKKNSSATHGKDARSCIIRTVTIYIQDKLRNNIIVDNNIRMVVRRLILLLYNVPTYNNRILIYYPTRLIRVIYVARTVV